ncbi:MAG: glycosyltransferase family 9 protein [Deltaproteobacteria bacterium]|nr:glycosyltransferase family 9 protein [Deltaproteobacteria bacterium]MBW2075086.1 glycosyltransferase family 9 protein [Deltaproteobacteria bacterium]
MKIRIFDNLLYGAAHFSKWRDKRETSLENFDKSRVRRILLILTTGLGDTILSTPAIRAARENFPDSTIKLFVRKQWHTLFQSDPYLDGLILYKGKYREFFKTIKRLKKEQPDLALILHGNDPDIIPLVYFSGAFFIIRIPNDTTRFRFLLSNQDIGTMSYLDPKTHYIENRLKIFNLIDCSTTDTRMYLSIDRKTQAKVDKRIEAWKGKNGRSLIGIHIFAADDYKVWPIDKQIELMERITSLSDNVALILSGSQRDRKRIAKIIERLRDKDQVINAAGLFSPIEMAALLKRLLLFIAPDTGLLHMAVAVNVPTISLFAPTDHQLIGPFYDKDRHLVIQKAPTCEDCITKRCKNNICMDQIGVDEVFEKFMTVMNMTS